MSDEKTEEPSKKKLDDARRDGETYKSTDLVTAAVLLLTVLVMLIGGPAMADALRALMSMGLDIGAIEQPDFDLFVSMRKIALQGMLLLLPFLLVAVIAAMAAIWAQTGINLSFKPVELKFDAINPASGLKRIFSVRSMIDLAKMTLKAILIFAVMWKAILLLTPLIVGVAYKPVLDIVQIAWQVLYQFLAIGGVLFLVMGVFDFGIQKWLFLRDHKMSKDEVKREYKDAEGDAHLKGKRKALSREMATTAPAKAVAGAQAVIVNPTHYAVALRYDPSEFGLPRVVAKGLDMDALEIRRLAQQHGVPVIGNPPLARALYTVPLEEAIPEALFETVAVILKWVRDIGVSQSDAATTPSSSYLVDPL